MRVNRLSKATVYSRVTDLVIATTDQYNGEGESRFRALTTDLEIIPQLGFTQRGPGFTGGGAGSSHLASMDVASALEAGEASSIFIYCTWGS